MLSRVAESMFWMSRYVERAENVGRFVDVNCDLMLDSGRRQAEQWQALVNTTGDNELFAQRYAAPTKENVIRFLTFDRANLNSIYCCVRAARENARTVRDVISSDMWEQINTFYLMINEPGAEAKALENPYEFFNQVKMASHHMLGVTDSTLSHGEGWNFCRLGRFLERADKSSRILDVKYYMLQGPQPANASQTDDIQWGAVLKSASALEMYRKKYRRIDPLRVVEFLTLSEEFPRSILFCLKTAQRSLHSISNGLKVKSVDDAENAMAQATNGVAAVKVDEILSIGLHQYLDNLQTKLNQTGEAIHAAFFGITPAETANLTQTQE